MRFTWRSTDAVSTYHDWFSRIGAKDNRPGRSAPSLAKSWAGVVAVAGALNSHEDLGDFALSSGAIEAQTAFDTFPGGKRNHDLLLVGTSSSGATVVSIEAKADEPFGQTVRAAVAAAEKREAAGKSTNAAKRVEQLVVALIKPRALTDDRVLDLRYQLLTGMAGTVAAATAHEAVNAVFLVHEFITPATTPDTQRKNAKALHELGTTVFDIDFPAELSEPWCVGPLDIPGDEAALRRGTRLYIAKAVTDWTER